MSVHHLMPKPLHITESEVNNESLIRALRTVSLTAKIDEDGDLYLSDGLDWPIWLRLEPEALVVVLYSFVDFPPEIRNNLGAIASRYNEAHPCAQFIADTSESQVIASAYYFYDEMLLIKQFVRLLHCFASNVHEANTDLI
jgi:hypothetical protein